MDERRMGDPGAARERTVLAWNRSALALAANGVLLARQGFGRHLIALEVVGFAVVGVAAAAWVFSIVRYPNVLARRRELVAAAGGFVCLLSVGELVLAAT